MITLLFILLFLFILIGVPVAVALGASTMITIVMHSDFSLAKLFSHIFDEPNSQTIDTLDSLVGVTTHIFDGLDTYTLMAIPMFIVAGAFLSKGSAAGRIIEFAKSLVGHLPGGLPIAAIFACVIFAAVSGSSPATVVAIGSIMYGAIREAGYPPKYAIGTIATAGSLGILIPPSIIFIVYGVTANESIGKLFVAGIIPGLLLGFMLMAVTYVGAKRLGFKRTKMASPKVIFTTFKDAIWGLMLIVIVIGGIYGGLFTPTEAGAVSAVYAFIVSMFIYKDLKLKQVYAVLLESALTSAMIFFIIANAMIFSHFLTDETIPQQITQMIIEANVGPIMFLIIVNFILFLMGQFMEPSSVVMITVPLLLPIALQLGINPIHFGVIMVVNMELGMITPPVGLNLFVASGVTGLSLKDVVLAALPWSLTMLVGLLLITYIPAISLWLPNLMFG